VPGWAALGCAALGSVDAASSAAISNEVVGSRSQILMILFIPIR
jgi:hypothetical protein